MLPCLKVTVRHLHLLSDKHPDTEKHSCSSHKHFPVVGIESTTLESESRVAAHCATRPSKWSENAPKEEVRDNVLTEWEKEWEKAPGPDTESRA
ncbi:jg25388 [Pararge aegeria aegeria]|uniref:Jg25388 protein n=1 Tax=Pararge aegeria aegeria TaxID=348720 RepID=A0A8S4S126_9NEOP|nr:jg25388 [Pararge aegeria aegeria]